MICCINWFYFFADEWESLIFQRSVCWHKNIGCHRLCRNKFRQVAKIGGRINKKGGKVKGLQKHKEHKEVQRSDVEPQAASCTLQAWLAA
jgi:hypothetical protein